jgi:hypothetical protein
MKKLSISSDLAFGCGFFVLVLLVLAIAVLFI